MKDGACVGFVVAANVGGESLEDIRERAVFFFLEALVGEFLLSLNLKDFIATAAMDQRRAIARVSASERGRREEETGAAYKPESSLSCSLANAGHTAGTGGLSSSMPVFPAVSSQTNRYIPAGDEGCCELLRPSLAVRESAFTSTELGGGGGADALGHRIASCAVEPFSVREDQARGSRRMDQLRFQDRYSVVRNSRAYTPGSQCNSGSSTTLSPSVQLPVVAGDVGGAKTQFKWGSSRDSLAKSQPSDNSPPTGNCPSAAGCQLSKQREQSCTCCHRPTLDCRSIDRGGDEFAQQKNQETTVGDRQSLHDSKAWCDHQCEVANQVGGGCFGSSANQNGTGGDLGLTTRRCDAIGTLMGNSRPAWEGTCHSPRAPFITRPLTNDATPSPINAVLPQSVKGSQASDPSAKGSVGLAREDGGRCLSGDMSSSVSCSLHVMNDISMGHPGQQGVSFTSFCHSQPGDCGTAADKQVVVSLGTQSAQPGLESVVNSGTGKRQRRRRRRRKRTDVIGSPDGEDVNEDNGLRQAKDSRRTASAGCLPNSADAYVFSAECITRDVVHLGDGSPDGAEGPDDLEEFEFASVASCASMLYQHGLTTDDEHEYGCTHTKTKLSDRAHELEATNAEQAEIQAAQMDAVSEVTLTSEACFSTRVEQILKERQAAARRGTPSGLATAGTSDGTGNTASVNLSATAAVQSPKFNTEGIGKDETPTELGKGKWMCSVPEPCRRAGDAGYVGYTSEAVVGTLTALEDQGVTHLASGKVPVCSSSGGTTQESASLSLTTVKSSNEVSQMKCIGRSAVLSSNGEEDSVRSSHGYAKHGSGEMHTTSTLTDGQRTMFTQFLFFEEGHKIFSPRHVLPKMGGDRLQTRPTDRRSEIHARDTMPTKISQLGEHSVAVLKDLSAVTERPQRKSSEDGLGSQLDAQKSSCPPAVAQGGDVVAEAPLEAKGTWLDPKNMDISGELPTRDANAQPDDVNKNSSERFSRDPDNQSGAMEERRLSTDGSQGNIAVGRATVDDQSGHGNIVNAPKSTEPRMVGPRSRVLYDGENRNVYASQVDWCPKEESPRDITGTCDSKETPLRQRKGEPTVNVGIKKWEKEEQDASTLSGSLSWGKYAQCMQNESECLSTSTPTGDTPNGCALLPSYTSSNDDANHINKLTEEPLVCRSAVEGSQPMRGNTFEGGKKHGEGIAGSLLQTETGSGVYEGKPTCVRYPGSNNGSCAARSEPELNVLISGLRSDTQEMDPIIHMTDFCCDSVTSVKYGTDMCVKAVCDGRSRHFKEFLEDKDDGGRECQIRPEPQTSFVRDELATNQLATAEELSTSQKCVHGYLVTEPSLERRNELLHVASFEAKGRDGWVQSQRAHDDGRGAPRETPARGRPEQSGRIDYEEHSNSRFPLSMWQSAGAVEGVLPRIQSKCCVRRASSIPSLTASNKAIPGRQPAEGAKPWMEQKSLSKWHTFELRRARSFPDTRYYASRESGILALRMSTSSVCECAFERESLTSHDRQKRGSIRNPKHDGSDSGTEFAVRHQQPSSALRVSACGAMLPAEERKLRSATRRCRRQCVRTDTTKDDAGVELHANETKPWDNHRSGNGCGKNANDSTTTSEKKTGTLMAIRRFECRHWSDSLLGSLLERIGRSRQYNETGVEEASASSGTEEMAPESEHVANRLSEEAGVPCGKDKRGVATGMSSTRSSKDNFWSDGHAQVSPRGYRVLLMKRTVAQCVAASVASGLWLPPLSSLEAGFSAAGRQGRSLQADAASGTVSGSIEKERDGDSSRNGSVAVLVITHACVIRELLQALCGRRFGNTIKAGSITILDVYTRRTGNTELRRSVRRRRSEAWMWLTGRGSHAHQHMGDGRDQTTGTVENGLDHHASTCCSVHPSDFGRNDANMADDADWRLSGDPEMLSREQGQGEEAGDAGPHAQEAGEGDDVQIDTNNTSGATACASSSLVDDNCLSNSGHPESLTGTRVHVFKADVPSCSGERSRGNTENRPPGGLLNDIQCSGERTHCNVSHDENVQNRRPERDTASMSQQNQDESENGSFNHSKTVADATVCQCQIKNLVGSGSYGSRPHGTYLANHSLSGREESLAELSDIDEEEVDLDHGDLSLLAAPYRSKRLFASEQRTEALDALLSRVQCWVEVFNKKE
ncbi:conserved hypothetical protein [Neospora caninum Liverpool]|uniref:Phosphoglycerate mutase family protein n=1 Tax=Neospora caninum (strain Liverpool) TaxID=572307 RepID=F0VH14_NEOCL|nr:conserved hypothetical protein [Neospora caninum Liverpool]CBZ53008.1 conserved hypothetical protein [Neospora caninum Liverpool]|eukprot:XP_003883040.1 conserved hypothetical protein [Neospora caninum Liverpool]